ncbi:nucleoside triphosphate pyrophosphohydrolase family protein [Anaerosinus massiliensis]|uniref:nucleoside triphosphate pyrophosphohydrolase family protein n=1 Tax=Massilibacillus massiliensis TaxID=1806837 RepID=UPI000A49B868|nr:nucleoside triphosphate pyrophosphohydrolase family protein [Massilibacillus massiliensis]
MDTEEYQKLAMRTASEKCYDLSNVGLGLAGESGEVADLIKKHLHQGHDLDKDQLIKELGDICWYIALCCELMGMKLEDVLIGNVEKLKKRYPNGFNFTDSVNRKY